MTLLPCPFCGKEATHDTDGELCWIRCMTCDSEGPVTETDEQAAESWNTRAVTWRPLPTCPGGWVIKHKNGGRMFHYYEDEDSLAAGTEFIEAAYGPLPGREG